MVWVERDGNGDIKGVYANRQNGYAEEELPDDDSAVVAFLAPRIVVPATISDRQFFQELAIEGRITPAEALAAVKTGAIPAALQSFVDGLPPADKFNAEMLLSGATVFERDHPLTIAIGAAQGMTSAQVDDFFRAAGAL